MMGGGESMNTGGGSIKDGNHEERVSMDTMRRETKDGYYEEGNQGRIL